MGEMTRQLNLRIPETVVQGLDEIASTEHIDRTALARKMLTEGIRRWRLDNAIRAYQQGEITKARAAELAGVPIYDILDEVRRRNITPSYTIEELREDLTALAMA